MIYCSVTDVRNALAQGESSDTNTAADMSDTIIEDAIAEAGAVIDSYVGGPYGSNDYVPGVIQYWCRDVGAYLATLTWRKSKDLTSQDPVVLRYLMTLQLLQDVRDDLLVIASPGNGLGPDGGDAGPPDIDPTVVNSFPPASQVPLFVEWDYDLYGAGTRMNARSGRPFPYWGGKSRSDAPADTGKAFAVLDPGPPGG